MQSDDTTIPRRALITGINGMDGSHMADFLLEKGYEVLKAALSERAAPQPTICAGS